MRFKPARFFIIGTIIFAAVLFSLHANSEAKQPARISESGAAASSSNYSSTRYVFIDFQEFTPESVELYKEITPKDKLSSELSKTLEIISNYINQNNKLITLHKYYQQVYTGKFHRKAPPIVLKLNSGSPKFVIDSLTYIDRAGKKNTISEYIQLDPNIPSLDEMYSFAHEIGHYISYLIRGKVNVLKPASSKKEAQYSEKDYIHIIEDNKLKSNAGLMKFIAAGDPNPNNHWNEKVTTPLAAFEEGFAIFHERFYSSSLPNDIDFDIAGKNFLITRFGNFYKSGSGAKGYLLDYRDTGIVKSIDQLFSTEFFVAMVIHRVVTLTPDPNKGYGMLLKIMADPKVVKNPGLESFLTAFAEGYPSEYSLFIKKFGKEFENAVNAKISADLSDSQKKNAKNLISAVQSKLAEAARKYGSQNHRALTQNDIRESRQAAENTVTQTSDEPARVNDLPVQSLKIIEINKTINSNDISN